MTILCVRLKRNEVSLLGNVFNVCLNRVRNKYDIPIKWVKPTPDYLFSPRQTGDDSMDLYIDWKKTPLIYEKSAEYQTADEIIKKLYTFEFLGRKPAMKRAQQEIVSTVNNHKYDFKSFEATIAARTIIIRNLSEIMLKDDSNKRVKVYLKETVEKRQKNLRHLRRGDYKRFEWLLEKLNIFYRPPPKVYEKLDRDEAVKRLTASFCEELRNRKMEAYKCELESKKADFLKEKVSTLEWVRKEEIECGITPTVTEKDIEFAKKRLSDYLSCITIEEQPEDPESRITI